jgi:DNA repair exonuclease SbcCD ATPase subunit
VHYCRKAVFLLLKEKEIIMPDKIETTEKDSLPKGQTSDSGKETTPKTYTEDEVKKIKSDALAEAGRKHKEELTSATKERDEYKSKLSELQSNVEDTKADYEKTQKRVKDLESDLETQIGDNVDLKEIQATKRKLRDAETQLESDYKAKAKAVKEEKEALLKEKEEWTGQLNEFRTSKFEIDVAKVAEEYGADVSRLKTLCEKAGKKSLSDIEDIASVLWTKKTNNTDTTMPTDSGTGSNMRGFTPKSIANMSNDEYQKNRDKIMEAYNKGLIKK